MTEVNAVVPRQVARRLAGSDDVIGSDAVVGVRERDVDDLRAPLAVFVNCRGDGGFDLAVQTLRQLVFLGDTDAQARDRAIQIVQIIGRRFLDARAVPRVVAGDHVQKRRAIGDVSPERADLIEAAGEGDQPVAADAPVSGLEADDAAH